MKKFLRFIGILLLIIVLVIVILGIVEPKDVTVERSLTINAPREVVWDQMTNFKNGPNWDPWYKLEPTVTRTYFGTDGQAGSGYTWEGKKTGKGTMTDTGIAGNKMSYKLHFEKPWSGDASGFYSVEDAGNGTVKATWNYYQHMSFPMNAMQAFMSMDKMMGAQFDSGLNNLKRYAESNKASAGSGSAMVQDVHLAARTYAGVRKTVAMADLSKVYGETSAMVAKQLGSAISGPAAGFYYTWDTVKHVTDMAVVFPISDTTKIAKGLTIYHVNASPAVMGVLKGGYGNEMAVHGAINKHMAEKNQKMSMVIEEYVIGKHEEPDSNKWVTNIYYLTK